MIKNTFNKKYAFSLLELSICFVVIALILASIAIGANMMKSAKLRNLVKEYNIYRSAILNFKTNYNALPGDMINATSILSISSGLAVAGNGNGNGLLDTNAEKFLLPQHLQAAGVISGYYNGLTQIILSLNTPNSWSFSSFNQVFFNIWKANEVNLLYYNKNNNLSNGSISPIDAYSLDTKIDDGNATTGNMYVMTTSSYDCIRTSNGTGSIKDSTYTGGDANYSLSAKTNECELLFEADK